MLTEELNSFDVTKESQVIRKNLLKRHGIDLDLLGKRENED